VSTSFTIRATGWILAQRRHALDRVGNIFAVVPGLFQPRQAMDESTRTNPAVAQRLTKPAPVRNRKAEITIAPG
jgi:hypothetical protein